MSDSPLSVTTTVLPPAFSRGEASSPRGQPGRSMAEVLDKKGSFASRNVQAADAGYQASAGAQATTDPANAQAVAQGQRAEQAKEQWEGDAGQKTAGKDAAAEADLLSRNELEQVVESINDFLQSSKRSLEFSVDDSSGRTIIKVMDAENEEVIRQIPPESALELIAMFRDGNGVTATGLVEKA